MKMNNLIKQFADYFKAQNYPWRLFIDISSVTTVPLETIRNQTQISASLKEATNTVQIVSIVAMPIAKAALTTILNIVKPPAPTEIFGTKEEAWKFLHGTQ